VVLPQWLDTYDCAARVEWLGIGQYGNRTAAPDVNAQEFSESLLKVLVDERFVERSMMIKELCVKSEGREVAYAKIAELIRSEEAS
jgi:UDP:flavonoid glycosyltransferase YjiC (YdhE family)